MEVGGWWVCPGLIRKIKQNWNIIPKWSCTSTDIWGWVTVCILCVHMLLKVVSHYDLSVLSMSMMVSQNIDCELYPVFVWILRVFLTLRSP